LILLGQNLDEHRLVDARRRNCRGHREPEYPTDSAGVHTAQSGSRLRP
jgi:hypothetical protein